jgi:hypothetical protein
MASLKQKVAGKADLSSLGPSIKSKLIAAAAINNDG